MAVWIRGLNSKTDDLTPTKNRPANGPYGPQAGLGGPIGPFTPRPRVPSAPTPFPAV
jgi:hypothetical protein